VSFRDLLVIAAGNLWRMKLRTTLTISGVLIAIAAFVAMLSFGAGNQAYVEGEFSKFGLFSTMQVYAKKKANDADTATYPALDAAALERLSVVPGVNLVYPYDAMTVRVRLGDSTHRRRRRRSRRAPSARSSSPISPPARRSRATPRWRRSSPRTSCATPASQMRIRRSASPSS
jgi:hypothetical protein